MPREERQRFERTVMPHLAASYNLARWLTRNDHDAEDMVQESYLRALQSFDRYRGGDPRAWLLTIVRNTCYSWLRRRGGTATSFDGDEAWAHLAADPDATPEARSIRQADGRLIQQAIEELPLEFREAFVLREIEGFSYKQIADVADVPLGTVMSRLARARHQLQRFLLRQTKEGGDQ